MSSAQRQVVRARMQLVATSATELWVDLSPFMVGIGVTRVRGRLVLCDKVGNFQCSIGIQTHTGDPEIPDAPIPFTVGTGFGQVSAVGRNFIDFDPTGSTNGNIATKAGFRLGLLYSSTGATVVRGDVILELYIDA